VFLRTLRPGSTWRWGLILALAALATDVPARAYRVLGLSCLRNTFVPGADVTPPGVPLPADPTAFILEQRVRWSSPSVPEPCLIEETAPPSAPSLELARPRPLLLPLDLVQPDSLKTRILGTPKNPRSPPRLAAVHPAIV
jgi:hypothetical protein